MKFSCQKLLGLFLLAALAFSPAADARFPHGLISTAGVLPSGFSNLKVGGGGFVTGINFNGSVQLARTDTAGAYKVSGGVWQQLFTASSMPTAVVGFAGNGIVGAYGIASAPSNGNRIYTMRNSIVYTTTDGAANWTVCTNWTSQTGGQGSANDGHRFSDPKIAVDPANEQIVIVSTQNAGAWYSTDACANWTKVPAPVPTNDAAGYLFVFDSSGGTSTTPTRTNNVYLATLSASLIYKATTGVTGTWASTGGPTTTCAQDCFQQLAVANGGIILATDEETNKLYRYNRAGSAAWDTITNMSEGGNGVQAIAVNPSNTKEVTIVNAAGSVFSHTADITVVTPTWSPEVAPANSPQTDVPWLGYTTNNFMTVGGAQYDGAGNVYVGAGIGVFKINPVTQSLWISQTAGIENLTVNYITSPPFNTGHPILCIWDRMMMYITAGASVYPSQNQLSNNFNACWAIDWSATGNTIVVMLAEAFTRSLGSEVSGYSTDGGLNYTAFGSVPAQNVALASSGTPAGSTPGVNDTLHFGAGGIPANVSVNDAVIDQTQTGAVNANLSVTALNNATGNVTLSGFIASPGVSTSDSIQFLKLFGGSITAGSNSNFMWANSNSPDMYFTTNIGTSWAKSTIASDPNNVGWTLASINNTHQIEADRNVAGKFWAYNNIDGKVYTSTNNGANFASIVGQTPASLVSSIIGAGGQPADMRTVPGQSGHAYIASNNHFIRTTDGGLNWATLANCPAAGTYAFGKVATGHTYPTIYAVGCSAGYPDNRIYKSVDGDQATPTFTLVGTAPWLDQVLSIAGDWNIEGQFYFGYTGSSAGGFHP